MTVACYVHPGKRREKEDSQRADMQTWLQAHGIDGQQVKWYTDKENTPDSRRPAFERLQQDIAAGKVQAVVLWKLDRLSPRLKEGVGILADWCRRGLRIVVVTQQLEFSRAVGRTLAAIMTGLSEIERDYRRERQAAGIAAARRQGMYKGRKPGSTKGKPARAQALRGEGLAVDEIAKALGLSERTIWRYLNPPPAEKD